MSYKTDYYNKRRPALAGRLGFAFAGLSVYSPSSSSSAGAGTVLVSR